MYLQGLLHSHFCDQNVDDNWQTGKCVIEEFPLELDDYFSSMDSTRIVRINNSKHCCEIYNRWTLELEKVISKTRSLYARLLHLLFYTGQEFSYPDNWDFVFHARNSKLLAIYPRFMPYDAIVVWDIESGEEVSYQDGWIQHLLETYT